ncbi:MAG: 4-hydroxythreonine-4-phosphate dehydrogenase PdxA [Candidatus Dadabacteria bacterium]|nr:4-hydroxythreonine-4-phosphate dehydrogenase PdxA [Candidatus Dadabacteria bacterium]
MKEPVIGITMGDACGIGPEVVVKALESGELAEGFTPVVIGDDRVLKRAKQLCSASRNYQFVNQSSLHPEIIKEARPSEEVGRASLSYISYAVKMAMQGKLDAIVTAPISKESIHMAGSEHPGHTELIKEQSGAKRVAMMFEGGAFRVVLVTIHVPLSEVPGLITKDSVLSTIEITDESLKKLCGIEEPRIAVAGLNPHAGEGGSFGDEESRQITPAVVLAQRRGIDAQGPFPPDTLFYRAARGEWDVVVAMYHDQGLIPFKMLSFDEGVNVTLGLPFVRTSPDHGTAFDIAWKGTANPRSMIEAVKTAIRFSERMG